MKYLVVYTQFLFLILIANQLDSQEVSKVDHTNNEYFSLEEALVNPDLVYSLSLDNENEEMLSDVVWGKFENLEFLSLKNIHLKELPSGIGNLIKVLPQSFSRLVNLQEIYLNDELQMDLEQSLNAIKDLPNLQILHLENDNLTSIPSSLGDFNRLKALYLNDNNFDTISNILWSKFENLEYLSLKNDHLKEIPSGIGSLKKLKVLDLSGNQFSVLPQTFAGLENLREIYLNSDKEMDVNSSLDVIKDLPNLKILHLENDNLKSVPKSLLNLTQLESLYLNRNNFNKVPVELKSLMNLKLIDLHDNNINGDDLQIKDSFGLKIRL